MATSLSDLHRSKLYAAERRFEAKLDPASHPLRVPVSVGEVGAFVNRWYPGEGEVRVDTHVGNTATAWSAGRRISLPRDRVNGGPDRWSRQPLVLLHEIAHLAIPYNLPGHGREFVASLRGLIRAYLEEVDSAAVALTAAAMLDSELEASGVRWEMTRKERGTFRHLVRKVAGEWSITVVLADGSQHVARYELAEDGEKLVAPPGGRGFVGGANANTPFRAEIAVDEIRYLLWKK